MMIDVFVLWLVRAGVAIVAILAFLVIVYLTAKLWSYGSAMGRHRFEERKAREKNHGA